MARRSHGFRQRMVSSGRKTFWLAGTHVRQSLSSADVAVLITGLNAAALALRPFTIVRTRGILYIRSDQTAASENQVLSYGEIVVTDQAVAIGVTAVPTPATDSGSSFHVYENMIGRFEFVSGVGFEGNEGQTLLFDSKAMRKVEEGQDLIAVAEADGISDGITLTSFSRTLIKLH